MSTSASATEPRGNSERSTRTSIQSKPRVNYTERDIDEEEDGKGTRQGGSKGDTELDDDEEEDLIEQQAKLTKMVESFTNARTKKDKAAQAKMEQGMKETLESARNDASKFIAARNEEMKNFVQTLKLDDTRYVGTVAPDNYRAAIRAQHETNVKLVNMIDTFLEDNRVDKIGFVQEAKTKLEERSRGAKRTKKKLDRVREEVIEERRLMAQRDLAQADKSIRHLKAAIRE